MYCAWPSAASSSASPFASTSSQSAGARPRAISPISADGGTKTIRGVMCVSCLHGCIVMTLPHGAAGGRAAWLRAAGLVAARKRGPLGLPASERAEYRSNDDHGNESRDRGHDGDHDNVEGA